MTRDIAVTVYDHYGDMIGLYTLDVAIGRLGISNELTVRKTIQSRGTAIGLSREGYVRFEKE